MKDAEIYTVRRTCKKNNPTNMARLQKKILASREFSTATQDSKFNIESHIGYFYLHHPTFVGGCIL